MAGRPTERSRAAAPVLAGLFFLAVTALMTWPQAAHLGDRLNDLWDAKQNAWILHWDFWQSVRDPVHLFQAPILHPARYALAFSENLYGGAIFGFPLLALGAPIVVNYNAVFLFSMAFSAWAAWLLARYVTGDGAASLLAGLVYAFVPWRFAQLPHINMQFGGFLCLIVFFLLKYLDRGRRRDLFGFAVSFAGNLLSTFHFGLFAGFLVATMLVCEFLSGGVERRRRMPMVLLAAAAAGLACAPFLIPYTITSKVYGMQRTLGEVYFYSAVPSDFLSAGVLNRLYGAATKRWSRGEGDLFPGIAPVLLAAAALILARRPRREIAAESVSAARRRTARVLDVLTLLTALAAAAGLPGWVAPLQARRLTIAATVLLLTRLAVAFPAPLSRLRLDRRAALFLCIGLVGGIVCLGAHTPYYRLFFLDVGSVFRAIRAPIRAIVLCHIALGVLAAWGLSRATRTLGIGARSTCVAAALALTAFEYRAAPLDLYAFEPKTRAVDAWLRAQDDTGPVLEWPLGMPYDSDTMLRQAAHGKVLVNGHQSYYPPAYRELVRDMGARPIAPEVWDEIARLEARTVIFHPERGPVYDRVDYRRFLREGLERRRLRLLKSFADTDGPAFVFRLALEAAQAAEPAAPSPDAGSQQDLDALMSILDADLAPPTGIVHLPAEGQTVAPGFWVHGWAVDDSGIARVEAASELGPAGPAMVGTPWPGLAGFFPTLPGADRGGWGFAVPPLPPGPHTLRVTLVGNDGGKTLLERKIVVAR